MEIVGRRHYGRKAVPAGKEQEAAPYEVSTLKPDIRRIPKPTQEEYAYSYQDFIQIPFIAPKGADAYFKQMGAFKIKGHQDGTRGILADGDMVYFDGGTKQGLKVGDRLVVTKTVVKNFHHPDDKNLRKPIGDVLQQQGVLRITTTYPDSAVAVIEHALDGIFEGSFAVPYIEPANMVANLRKDVVSPIELKQLGKIIFLREERPVAATGDMVIIDQGTANGLKVGDVLITARIRNMNGAPNLGDKPGKIVENDTNYYVGQMVVVRAEDTTATCRILRSREEIFVGDIVTR